MSEPIIGVNIEDNHISVGLVDIDTRKVVSGTLQRKRVNPMGSAEQILDSWTKVLREVARDSKQIGISLPGSCDYESGVFRKVSGGRYDSLDNVNLKDVFSLAIGVTKDDVKMMNDAASFLQGEVFCGSGRGFKSSLGFTLGIGLGSAKYKNGVVVDAALFNAPLFDGVAEDYISVKWILRRFNELTGLNATEMSELRQMAETHPQVGQVFEEFATNLSIFLESEIRNESPEIVVIGGFMEIYNRFFFDSLTAKIAAKGIKIPVLRAILGEQASVIGAASSWYVDAPIHA